MPCQTQLLQRPDSIPVHINLIPCNSMTGGNRMRMMIVVPAFTKGQQSYPPAVGGKIFGGEAASAPAMSSGIHQPRGMQPNHCPNKNSPKQELESAAGPPATLHKKKQETV